MVNLSVVVPVAAGRLVNLRNTIHALLLQTLPKERWELIIVNDGSEDDVPGLLRTFPTLTYRYIFAPKFVPRQGIPPRNAGARLARYKHIVFLDSDVMLDKEALALYAADFERDPKGVVAGVYDWLPPCRIGPSEVEGGLESIYELAWDEERQDRTIQLKIKPAAFPNNRQTHNVCRDMRRPMFEQTEPDVVYTGPGHENVYLGCFSGNIGYAADTFWGSGGFWEDLTAGLVDDGALGLTLWAKSFVWHIDDGGLLAPTLNEDNQPIPIPKFQVRLDKRIVGAHQYHDRNVQWVQIQSAKEVDLINRRFGKEQYQDGRVPVLPKPVYALTADAHIAWGVDRWEQRWTQDEPATAS